MLSYLSELAQLRSENALCCSLRTRSCTGRWGRAAACRERAAARREQEAAGRGGRCAGRDPSKGDALTNIARQALLTETLRRSTSSYSSPSASVSPTACSRRTCVPSLRSTNSTWGPTFTLASRVPGGCHRSAAPPTGHPTACHGWRKWWKRRRRRRRRGRRCMVTKAKKRMVRIHLRCKSSPLDSHRSRHLAAEQWQPVTN